MEINLIRAVNFEFYVSKFPTLASSASWLHSGMFSKDFFFFFPVLSSIAMPFLIGFREQLLSTNQSALFSNDKIKPNTACNPSSQWKHSTQPSKESEKQVNAGHCQFCICLTESPGHGCWKDVLCLEHASLSFRCLLFAVFSFAFLRHEAKLHKNVDGWFGSCSASSHENYLNTVHFSCPWSCH